MDLSVVGLKNQRYSEQELDIIRRSRQACTKKIKVLRDETRGLKVQIRQLNIGLAPHNKLPPEMLRRIFELCCEEPAEIPYSGNISIELEESDDYWQLQIAEQWFSRAGNHPRSLIFMDRQCYTTFHLSLPRTQIVPLKELLTNGPFSGYLEVLEIGCSQSLLEKRWPDLFAPTTRLTKLIHVRVAEWTGQWNFQNLMTVIPWNQLQHLDLLSGIPYSHCLDILFECASLVCCHMHVDDIPMGVSSARRPVVTLPALRVLQLFFKVGNIGNNGSHVERTIRFLNVPSLSHLTLGQRGGRPYINSDSPNLQVRLGAPAICELLERSNGMPDLISLDLGVRSRLSPPIDVRALLTKTPRLRLLHVRNGIFGEEVRNDIATGILAPQLRSIMTEVTHEAIDILRMVEMRHQNARMTPVDNTKQVMEFSSISFPCLRMVDSRQYSVFSERLASLKKAAPRLSTKLSFLSR